MNGQQNDKKISRNDSFVTERTIHELEEREEEQYYYYVNNSPHSAGMINDEQCANYDEELASETATINFLTDDRDYLNLSRRPRNNNGVIESKNETPTQKVGNTNAMQSSRNKPNNNVEAKKYAHFKLPTESKENEQTRSAETTENDLPLSSSFDDTTTKQGEFSRRKFPSQDHFANERVSGFGASSAAIRRDPSPRWLSREPLEVYYEYLDEAEIHECDRVPIPPHTENEIPKSYSPHQQVTKPKMQDEHLNSSSTHARHSNSTQLQSAQTEQQHVNRARGVQNIDNGVDYSSRSFRDAKAAINAAAQRSAVKEKNGNELKPNDLQNEKLIPIINNNDENKRLLTNDNLEFESDKKEKVSCGNEPLEENEQRRKQEQQKQRQNSGVRVRHVGDTTIITQHVDPYSFYWQLDQTNRREDLPKRRRPPQTTIIDEEQEDESVEEADEGEAPMPNVEKTVLSPDSNDSGVNMESYYAKPYNEPLPKGWERHKDPSGYSYYWHVDSGVIQREPPTQKTLPRSSSLPQPQTQTQPQANTEQTVDTAQPMSQNSQLPLFIEEQAFRQTTTKRRVENRQSDVAPTNGQQFDLRFATRSLGCAELAEEDLQDAERSSRAVNTVISRLSRQQNNLTNNGENGKWANGRKIFLDLDDEKLILRDAQTLQVLDSKRIQHIRVWGVGKENPQEFAYVIRDPRKHRFVCHVFRCESAPGIQVANALRDLCARILNNQRSQHERERLQYTPGQRPTNLNVNSQIPASASEDNILKRVTRESLLLTPIDEPKRLIRCHFIGITQVPKATGIDTLNEAVDRLVCDVGPDRWLLADVSVAPSAILIHEATPTAPLSGTLTRARPPVAECRVRFLSFLGIGRDIKHCAFIMHNASTETYLCYIFRVEPNAALMAKTIEAACKLRYQKVLDAHLVRPYAHAYTNSPHGTPLTTTTTFSH